MKKTNIIALIAFVAALVWVFSLDNETIRNLQSKVLGIFGGAQEAVASVSFDDDHVNGEAIGPEAISQRYDQDVLAARYSKLLHELFELRYLRSQMNTLVKENTDLKRSLNFVEFKKGQNQALVAARVMDRQSGSWWKTIVIDKGSEDGVVVSSPVLTPVAVDQTERVEGALVGKVTTVGKHQSVVVLATDEECNVGAYVFGVMAESASGLQRVQGILSGAPAAGSDVPYLVLRNLPKEGDRYGVKTGAKVYSSGIENDLGRGVFPPGLILGTISEFEVKDIDAEARVKPAIDFNTLSHVFVLLPADAGEEAEIPEIVAMPSAASTAPKADEVSATPPTPSANGSAPAVEPTVPRANSVGGGGVD